jgi:large subunit ribosomal protein L20
MSRIKRGTVTKKRHKRVLKKAKGYYALRGTIFRRAQETVMRAMAFAFKSRKLKKRDFRALFITRISGACSTHGIPYNKFINGLKKAKIQLNRKMLSQLAIFEPKAFEQLVEISKK